MANSSWEADNALARSDRWNGPLCALLVFLLVLIFRPSEIAPALTFMRPALLSFAVAFVTWWCWGRRELFLQPKTSRWAVSLLVVMVVSIPFSYWPRQSLDTTLIFVKQLVVYLLIMNIATSIDAVRRLLAVLLFAFCCHSVAVIKRFFAGELILDRVTGVAGGAFGDPNDLALALVMMVPVAILFCSQSASLFARLTSFVALLLLVGGVIATQSRGGLLGLAAVSLLIVIASQRRMQALLGLMASAMIVVMAAPDEAFERFGLIADYQADESAMTRLHIWRAGLEMWADHPLLGVGAGAFSTVYGELYRDSSFPIAVWYDAHSSLIKVMAELGTVGVVVWCGMILSAMIGLAHSLRRLRSPAAHDWQASQLKAICQTLLIALCGYLVCGMFLSRSYDWMLMIFLSLAVVAIRLEDDFWFDDRVEEPC